MLRFLVVLYFEGKFTIYLVVVTDNESIDHIKKNSIKICRQTFNLYKNVD